MTVLVVAYAAMALGAIGLGAWLERPVPVRHPSPIFQLGWGAPLVSIALGLVVAAITIGSTQLLLERARWARALRRELKMLVEGASGGQLVLLALASGTAEELFFRGALQPSVGLVTTSLVFGLLHVGPRREFLPWTAWALVMGLVLGGVYELTGALEGPVIAHVLVNAVNLRVIARHDARLDVGDGRPPPPKLVARIRRQ